MNLDEGQRKKIGSWIDEGLKLSEIQNRIASELGLRMTYMDVRLLVDDLKLTPKDPELPKVPATLAAPAAAAPKPPATPEPGQAAAPSKAPGESQVSVSVDHLARPGAMVSGKVTFSDGNKAEWYFDQTGRLGLATEQPGYRPPAADLQQFQVLLEGELRKLGF